MSAAKAMKVASCAPIATQLATFDQNTATLSATANATISLKASALAALRRNRAATSPQPEGENTATLWTENQRPKLRLSQADASRWLWFMDVTALHGAPLVEVDNEFSDNDITDLLEHTDEVLKKCAHTIAAAILRRRRLVPVSTASKPLHTERH